MLIAYRALTTTDTIYSWCLLQTFWLTLKGISRVFGFSFIDFGTRRKVNSIKAHGELSSRIANADPTRKSPRNAVRVLRGYRFTCVSIGNHGKSTRKVDAFKSQSAKENSKNPFLHIAQTYVESFRVLFINENPLFEMKCEQLHSPNSKQTFFLLIRTSDETSLLVGLQY